MDAGPPPLISMNAAVDLYANQAFGHYIPALVQEALLLVLLGERSALEVLHIIDGWRASPHSALAHAAPPAHALQPPAAPAVPASPDAAGPASRLCARPCSSVRTCIMTGRGGVVGICALVAAPAASKSAGRSYEIIAGIVRSARKDRGMCRCRLGRIAGPAATVSGILRLKVGIGLAKNVCSVAVVCSAFWRRRLRNSDRSSGGREWLGAASGGCWGLLRLGGGGTECSAPRAGLVLRELEEQLEVEESSSNTMRRLGRLGQGLAARSCRALPS